MKEIGLRDNIYNKATTQDRYREIPKQGRTDDDRKEMDHVPSKLLID